MITQGILDFFRDVFVNWIDGVNSLTSSVDFSGAGSAIGGFAGSASHFLALFLSNGVWSIALGAWAAWLAVWITTALIAIIGRRGAGE